MVVDKLRNLAVVLAAVVILNGVETKVAIASDIDYICANQRVPNGWVVTRVYTDVQCGTGTDNAFEIANVNGAEPRDTRYVCHMSVVPPGWVVTQVFTDLDCGNGVNNARTLLFVTGMNPQSSVNICFLSYSPRSYFWSPIPSNWVTTRIYREETRCGTGYNVAHTIKNVAEATPGSIQQVCSFRRPQSSRWKAPAGWVVTSAHSDIQLCSSWTKVARTIVKVQGLQPGDTLDVCRKESAPSLGWSETQIYTDRDKCGGGYWEVNNVATIRNLFGMAPGTVVNVCRTSSVPQGWTTNRVYTDAARCGTADEDNARSIVNTLGLEAGSYLEICAVFNNNPPHWVSTQIYTDTARCSTSFARTIRNTRGMTPGQPLDVCASSNVPAGFEVLRVFLDPNRICDGGVGSGRNNAKTIRRFAQDDPTGTTERVSVNAGGGQRNAPASQPSVSADGRFVAFIDISQDLVLVKDLQSGSLSNISSEAGSLTDVVISDNGRHVAYKLSRRIFLHDLETHDTQQLPFEVWGNRFDLSADGQIVVFDSTASNIVVDDNNRRSDIFVYDRQADHVERISIGVDGVEGNNHSNRPVISANGRFVAFDSQATNLVPGTTWRYRNVFVYDRTTRTIERVTVGTAGRQAAGNSGTPAISDDGRFITFLSRANNLVSGDVNRFGNDVFVRDRQTGSTQLVGRHNNAVVPNISGDGRYVLVGGPGNIGGVFLLDLDTGRQRAVDVDSEENRGGSQSSSPAMSANGHFIAFVSRAGDLVENDTNVRNDVFLRHLPPE